MGARTLTFREFRACRAPEFLGKKEPIMIRHWLTDVRNAFRSSLGNKETKVRLASIHLKDKARDWWEEVGHALGGDVIDLMT